MDFVSQTSDLSEKKRKQIHQSNSSSTPSKINYIFSLKYNLFFFRKRILQVCLFSANNFSLETFKKYLSLTKSVSEMSVHIFDNFLFMLCVLNISCANNYFVKFIYSEKATKFCEIFHLLLTVCTVCQFCGLLRLYDIIVQASS